MAELVLLRHGRTAWNEADRAQGHTDVPLDEVGREQAKRAASVLVEPAPARLWTSDLQRARQTAAALEEATGLVAQPDARLREFDVGERSGLTGEEFRRRFPERYAAWRAGTDEHLVAGEESASSLRERVVPALRGMLAALGPAETGVVVGHGACLKVAVAALLGLPEGAHASLRGMDNGGWAVLTQAGASASIRLAAWNRTV